MKVRKIVVGADGSPAAERAIRWAGALAADGGASVVVVTAADVNTQVARDLPPTGMFNWREDLKRKLRTIWVAPLTAAGVEHRCVLSEESPAAAITGTADAEGADLIVIGAHGHGGVRDRLLGSVSYRVVHSARQPVVVIPPDWDGSVLDV